MIGTSFFMSILPDSATAQIGLRGDVVPVFVVKPQRAAVEVIIAELWRKLCAEQECVFPSTFSIVQVSPFCVMVILAMRPVTSRPPKR